MMVGDKIDVDLEPAKKLGVWTVLIDRNNSGAKTQFVDFRIISLKNILNLPPIKYNL